MSDLVGRPLLPGDAELLSAYEALKSLAAREDLSPSVVSNVRQALAAVAQAVNSAGLVHEHLVDHGL